MAMSSPKIARKLPRIQRALCATGPGALALKTVPVPQIEPDQVLIHTAAVALNPSDHKLLDQSTTVGAISGSDYAGTVVQVGDACRHLLEVGDRVFGFVFGANPSSPTNGAFSQYVAAPADQCLHVPKHMDFTAAASMAMSLMTSGLAFRSLGLSFNEDDASSAHDDNRFQPRTPPKPWVFVHGGATATGTMMIQLLQLAGYRPVATCSPRSFELVKSRGAVHVLDYNDPSCRDQLRALTDNSLRYAFDCIGDAATMTLCYAAIGDEGGAYTALEAYPKKLTIRRRNVKHDFVLAWTLFGKDVQLAGAYHRSARPEDRQFGAEWAQKVQKLLDQRKLETHPLEPHIGSLPAIVPRMEQMRQGKHNGRKMVFPLSSS